MKKYDKQDLLFYFQDAEFPKKIITEDCLTHRDLLFNEKAEEHLIGQDSKKKHKYSASFILEDELDKKKPHGQRTAKPQPINWRKTSAEQDQGTGFLDNFKGKTDEKQVKMFKLNQELTMARENSYSITQKAFENHLIGGEGKIRTVSEPIVFTTSADLLFANSETFLTPSKRVTYEGLSFSSNPDEFNPKVLHKVNEYLQYPIDDQLWYIFHPVAKSSFGPLSTSNIEDMYNTKVLNGQMEIRFIDIYSIKGKKPFTFFKLKELENITFIDGIQVNELFRIAQKINKQEAKLDQFAKSTTESSNPTDKQNVSSKSITINNNIESSNVSKTTQNVSNILSEQANDKVINNQGHKESKLNRCIR
jgi:hypothetical protein